MTEYSPKFRSPIPPPTATAEGALRVSDLSGVPVILIQGEAGAALTEQFTAIPSKPGQVVDAGEGCLARLTPQELYLFGKSTEARLPSVAEVEAAFGEAFAHATDLTHGQAVVKLSGADAAQVLSKICGLDFHETVFPSGQVKQTSAAKIKTLIVRWDEAGQPTYYLHVSRPFGQYFWEIVWDAGQEFGISVGD